MRCIYENTNFESNSQLWNSILNVITCCVVSTKIQILKAIHNLQPPHQHLYLVALYLRKYKFWKQFTTISHLIAQKKLLRCIYENTNFESNSQLHLCRRRFTTSCVVSTKIQILKAIHNNVHFYRCFKVVALYLRKYKFWKQFTTSRLLIASVIKLRCIYENTNFESNSQLLLVFGFLTQGCVVSTKIQILKAIHNKEAKEQIEELVALYLRKYKFWKQFTTVRRDDRIKAQLRCIYENTNFESNSQQCYQILFCK